ncbi:MAG TPA: NTP transferase domain-containing protein [Acidimicrobiales bacterium]|jgi:molybdopterin-guanine dinucleotide biosynthesis protein A
MLLTGGASTRMGTDKASLPVRGVPMATRLGRLLAGVCGPAVEVGPGHSELPAVVEPTPGQGPLTAIVAGAAALRAAGWWGPVVVIACDLPLLTDPALRLVATWPGEGAAVPLVGGRRQPLCARWAPEDLLAARQRAAAGRRSLGDLPGAGPTSLLTPEEWGAVASGSAFADADDPPALLRLLAEGGADGVQRSVSSCASRVRGTGERSAG